VVLFGGSTLHREAAGSTPSPTVLTDEQLAYKMQMYVVIREFGRTVIAPTAKNYAIATGALGLIGNIPIASVISASLSVIDFVVNKFVISALPAKLDSLRIRVAQDTIFVGEQTNATVTVYAANDPQAVTIQDMVAQILNAIGLKASLQGPQAINALDDLKDVMLNVANYMLGLYQTGLSDYAGKHPELNLDIAVFTMPQLRWQAQITDTKFLDVKTHTPTLMQPVPNVVNWQADLNNSGEGRIFAQTTSGGATVIPQPPGFAYSAGAFGEDVAAAPAISVWTTKKLAMVVDFSPQISQGGANVLGVTAGHLDTAGTLVPDQGIKIDLFTIGGAADPVSGFTDANGQFNSVISLNPLTDTVTVHITATNTIDGAIAKDTVTATTQVALSRIAYVSFRDGAAGIWSANPNDTSDVIKLCTVQNAGTQSFPVRKLFWSKDAQWLVYTIGGFSGDGIYTTGGTVPNFQRTVFDPQSYFVGQLNRQSWFTTNPDQFLIGASHKTISGTSGQYICTGAGSKSMVAGSENRGGFISPDDQKLAVLAACGTGQVCIVTMDATNLALTTKTTIAGPFPTAPGSPTIKCHGWTEDGSSVIYSKETIGAQPSFEIWLVDANGANNRLLTSGTDFLGPPIVLPTQNALAFVRTANPGNNNLVHTLFTVTLNGVVTELTGLSTTLIDITASPDGSEIAYDDPAPPHGIYKVNLATSTVTHLVSDSLALTPAWSGAMK